ncbi:hypothetical protein Ahy_B05g077891 [Arachis hypogaea]|uniref:Uncharacterized protein n=1 Tax=Arachis hypogaea TaxID=3818 RepID=A0A444Z5T6_ARAHY|nr:hypothetical protein Ahy_B05g077891 [Arachis hypogaea]
MWDCAVPARSVVTVAGAEEKERLRDNEGRGRGPETRGASQSKLPCSSLPVVVLPPINLFRRWRPQSRCSLRRPCRCHCFHVFQRRCYRHRESREEALQQLNLEGHVHEMGERAAGRGRPCIPSTAADPCCAKPTALFLPSLAPPGFRPSLSLRELTGVVEVVTALCGSVLSCVGKPLRPENAPAAVAGKFCHCRDRNSSPLPLEVAAGLPPNRFGDRRCFGSAIPSLVRLLRKWLGTEVLAAGILIVDFGSRRKGFCDAFGLWFCVLRIWAQKLRRVHLVVVEMLCIVLVMKYIIKTRERNGKYKNAKGHDERAAKAETEAENLKQELGILEAEKDACFYQYNKCLEKISVLEAKLALTEENSRMLNEQIERAEMEAKSLRKSLAELNEEKEAVAFLYKQCLEKISTMGSEILHAHETFDRLNREIEIGAEKLRTVEEHCGLSMVEDHAIGA